MEFNAAMLQSRMVGAMTGTSRQQVQQYEDEEPIAAGVNQPQQQVGVSMADRVQAQLDLQAQREAEVAQSEMGA